MRQMINVCTILYAVFAVFSVSDTKKAFKQELVMFSNKQITRGPRWPQMAHLSKCHHSWMLQYRF